MDGRWILHVCKDCGQRAHYQERCQKDRRRVWTEQVEVPVVPCDDAAVDRAVEAAMDAIVESDDVIAYGDEPFPGWALKLAERAIAAGFKAAAALSPEGERPGPKVDNP